jgi:hypothetical protein
LRDTFDVTWLQNILPLIFFQYKNISSVIYSPSNIVNCYWGHPGDKNKQTVPNHLLLNLIHKKTKPIISTFSDSICYNPKQCLSLAAKRSGVLTPYSPLTKNLDFLRFSSFFTWIVYLLKLLFVHTLVRNVLIYYFI